MIVKKEFSKNAQKACFAATFAGASVAGANAAVCYLLMWKAAREGNIDAFNLNFFAMVLSVSSFLILADAAVKTAIRPQADGRTLIRLPEQML